VKVAHPDKPVVSITGDGGFLFGGSDLATAVQFGINLVTVVVNNASYGNVLRDQKRLFDGRHSGSVLTNPDFVAYARSFGVGAWRVEDAAGLKRALGSLDARSRRIIERRWLAEGDTATLHELATEYGVSAERIRQIEAKAMQKMRGELAAA